MLKIKNWIISLKLFRKTDFSAAKYFVLFFWFVHSLGPVGPGEFSGLHIVKNAGYCGGVGWHEDRTDPGWEYQPTQVCLWTAQEETGGTSTSICPAPCSVCYREIEWDRISAACSFGWIGDELCVQLFDFLLPSQTQLRLRPRLMKRRCSTEMWYETTMLNSSSPWKDISWT